MAGRFSTSEAKLHLATSMGAAVVIVGALFKILHLGGIWGSIIIGVGLAVEAFLFLLLGLFPPGKETEWDKVYPQLRADGKPTPLDAIPQVGGGGGGASSTQALDKMLHEAKIGPELIESLGTGLRTFSDKVTTISNTADASMAATEFTAKVKDATSGLSSMNSAFGNATTQLTELANSNTNSKAYHEQVNHLAKNLSALNAVYELELQDSSSHLKSMNKFYQNLAGTMGNFNESMEDSKQFKEEVGKLAKNLSSLNAIYGNMLTAMNQPRA